MRIHPQPPASPSPKKLPKEGLQATHFTLPKKANHQIPKDPDLLQEAYLQLMQKTNLPLSALPELHKMMASTLEGKPMPSKSEVEKILHQVASDYLESIKDSYHNPLVPFEQYADQVRAQLREGTKEYLQRFMNGFKAVTKR